MKFRRHHNNKGYRQIKNGSTRKQIKRIIKKLKKEKILKKPPNFGSIMLTIITMIWGLAYYYVMGSLFFLLLLVPLNILLATTNAEIRLMILDLKVDEPLDFETEQIIRKWSI